MSSGFFSIQRDRRGWSFFDPAGNRFVAAGFNHAGHKFLRAPYNQEHWSGRVESDEELERMVVEDVRALNMTAIGYGPDFARPPMPYVQKIEIPAPMTWADRPGFYDPFDEDFERRCREIVEEVCGPRRTDSNLIGYYHSDCIEWPDPERSSKRLAGNWLDYIKGLAALAPGKMAYVDMLGERYATIDELNRVYGTAFSGFQELSTDRDFRFVLPRHVERAHADDRAFLALLAERFFSVSVSAIRESDPSHLILGPIFDGNRAIPDEVLEAASRHLDVLSVQYYGYFKDQVGHLEHLHSRTALPILLADGCYARITERMPRPCGPRTDSEQARADHFELYARQALPQPYVLGWFWCGYVEGWEELEPRRQHSGIKDAWGNPIEPLWSRMRDTYAELLPGLMAP